MLIVLGAMNLSGALRRIKEVAHIHRPMGESAERVEQQARTQLRSLRPVAVGVVHGLAGSAAVALLVLATIKTPSIALFYLAVFGAGTVAGMMLLTLAMSLPIAALSKRFRNAELLLAQVTGLISIAFGLFLAYRIGIVDGLLWGTPSWDPH